MLLPRCGARPAGEGRVHGVQRGGAEEARQPPRVLGQLQGHEDDGNLQVRHVSHVGSYSQWPVEYLENVPTSVFSLKKTPNVHSSLTEGFNSVVFVICWYLFQVLNSATFQTSSNTADMSAAGPGPGTGCWAATAAPGRVCPPPPTAPPSGHPSSPGPSL